MAIFARPRALITLLPICCTFAMAQIDTLAKASPCQASQLAAAQDQKESDRIDGGVGNHAITIAVQNISSSPCVLNGVPELTLFDTAGHPLQAQVCRNCPSYLFRSQPVKEILLEPNKSAYLVIGYNINDGGICREPAWLGLLLPGDGRPVRLQPARIWRTCGRIDITPFLPEPPANGSLPDPANPEN